MQAILLCVGHKIGQSAHSNAQNLTRAYKIKAVQRKAVGGLSSASMNGMNLEMLSPFIEAIYDVPDGNTVWI